MKNLPLLLTVKNLSETHHRLGTDWFVMRDNVFVSTLIICSKNANTCIMSPSVILHYYQGKVQTP